MRKRPIFPSILGTELDAGAPAGRDLWADRAVTEGNREGARLRAASRPAPDEVALDVLAELRRRRRSPLAIVVTGGRDRAPTEEELALLGYVVGRVSELGAEPARLFAGDHPRGLDAGVLDWALGLRSAAEPWATLANRVEVFTACNRRARILEGRGLTVRRSADWGRDGRAAGPRRNSAMVRAAGGRGVLLAWPGGRGTADATAAARRALLHVVDVEAMLGRPADLDGDLVAWASQVMT